MQHFPRTAFLAFITLIVSPACAAPPLKVFVLAGQSNMEGQAVVDLDGEDYNFGKGTLASLLADPATHATYAHLQDNAGKWRVRDDVWVRYQPEKKKPSTGGLGLGFTPYLDQHHFGPELQFGHVLGDALNQDVLIVKTAWGGKSLFVDFRPPSSGGTTGPYYRMMIQEVKDAIANAATEFPTATPRTVELAGFVWYQGWNDGCDPAHAVPEYEANLVNLIRDVRKDLNAPNLPVVVGELTGPWIQAPAEWNALRQAQRAAATRAEFAGSVTFVPTAAFVRNAEDSPNPGHGHHEFGNAETIYCVGNALGQAMRAMVVPGSPAFIPTLAPADGAKTPKSKAKQTPKKDAPAERNKRALLEKFPSNGTPAAAEMAGYMLVSTEQVPENFNAGFSLYAAAWPLLKHYPGHRFQTGLFGTWMHAQYQDRSEPPKDLYSDIEGGLGWWRDTRFPTETPKFIMGGVAVNFGEIANGPAHGAGTWDDPKGLYGVAQLSPWLLFPIDGLSLKQGTCGQLFGYGYLPLPLATAKPSTAGTAVPTGDNCWTLFLNTANFKGPVCFFTPYFWSRSALKNPALAGLLLDSRPADPNKAFQMETQYVPAKVAAVKNGDAFARVSPISFPANFNGNTIVLHRLTSYTKAALFDSVQSWFAGGPSASGSVNITGAFVQPFKNEGGSTWQLYPDDANKNQRVQIDWSSFATPIAIDPYTYGYQWKDGFVERVNDPSGNRVTLPEYFRLDTSSKNLKWRVVKSADVPASTGLKEIQFTRPIEPVEEPYGSPIDAASSFKKPGPVAGPFEVTLGDGSVVTYSWYRFADQPALLQADLTSAEREEMQRKVEMIHRTWTKDRNYLPVNTVGTLADLDPAQLVMPPKGFEIGYVPIATRQGMPAAASK